MGSLKELVELLGMGLALAVVVSAFFLLYWFAPHPWDHVGAFFLGGLSLGFATWFVGAGSVHG